jgi:hypothetical protein
LHTFYPFVFFLSFFFCEFFSLFLAGEEEYKGYPVMAPPRWIDRCSCASTMHGVSLEGERNDTSAGPTGHIILLDFGGFFWGGFESIRNLPRNKKGNGPHHPVARLAQGCAAHGTPAARSVELARGGAARHWRGKGVGGTARL